MTRALWQAVEDVRVSCDHGPDAGGESDRAIRDYERWCAENGVAPDFEANVEAMGRRAAAASLFEAVPVNCALIALHRAIAEYPYTGTDPGVAIDAAEYVMEER